MKKIFLLFFYLFLLTFTLTPIPVRAQKEIWVPYQYTTIQEAIDAAQDGDKINVVAKAQPYYENIVINKKLALIGHLTPVIDGNESVTVVDIKHSNVYFSGFRIQNCEYAILKKCPHDSRLEVKTKLRYSLVSPILYKSQLGDDASYRYYFFVSLKAS